MPTLRSSTNAPRPAVDPQPRVDTPIQEVVKRKNRPTQQQSEHTIMRTMFRNLHDTAIVLVGKNKVRFTLHKGLLTAASPFFAACLNGNWVESAENTCHLVEERPDIFDWFVQWLYTGTLSTAAPRTCNENCPDEPRKPAEDQRTEEQRRLHKAFPGHNDGDMTNESGMPKYFLLIEIYGLSDRLGTTSFSNHIIDTIARLSEHTNSVPTPSDTWLLYGPNTTFSAPVVSPMLIRPTASIRDLIVDLFVYKKTDKLLASHADDWHPLFLRDLCVRVKRPGLDGLARHKLLPWKTSSWLEARACDVCKVVIGPVGEAQAGAGRRARASVVEQPAMSCERCRRVYCAPCVALALQGGLAQGDPKFSMVGQDIGACKPWVYWDGPIVGKERKGVCGRYHEHGPLGGRHWGNPEEDVGMADDEE